MSYRKVGGIHFLKIGKFNASWSVKTQPVAKPFTGKSAAIVITGRNLKAYAVR